MWGGGPRAGGGGGRAVGPVGGRAKGCETKRRGVAAPRTAKPFRWLNKNNFLLVIGGASDNPARHVLCGRKEENSITEHHSFPLFAAVVAKCPTSGVGTMSCAGR